MHLLCILYDKILLSYPIHIIMLLNYGGKNKKRTANSLRFRIGHPIGLGTPARVYSNYVQYMEASDTHTHTHTHTLSLSPILPTRWTQQTRQRASVSASLLHRQQSIKNVWFLNGTRHVDLLIPARTDVGRVPVVHYLRRHPTNWLTILIKICSGA